MFRISLNGNAIEMEKRNEKDEALVMVAKSLIMSEYVEIREKNNPFPAVAEAFILSLHYRKMMSGNESRKFAVECEKYMPKKMTVIIKNEGKKCNMKIESDVALDHLALINAAALILSAVSEKMFQNAAALTYVDIYKVEKHSEVGYNGNISPLALSVTQEIDEAEKEFSVSPRDIVEASMMLWEGAYEATAKEKNSVVIKFQFGQVKQFSREYFLALGYMISLEDETSLNLSAIMLQIVAPAAEMM